MLGYGGYTLHETLIAMMLISIGILAFAMNTRSVIQGNHRSDTLTIATNLAQDKIEELRARPTLTIQSNCSGPGLEPADSKITATGATGGIYDRCWTVHDPGLGDGLKQIDVTVSWADYGPRKVAISTLVYGR